MAEALIRLPVFVAMLVIMLLAEALWPRRERTMDVLLRWPGNFGAALIGTTLVRLLLPASAIGVALAAEESGIGLFNMTGLPALPAVLLSVVALDFIIYWQHRLFHRVPALWRIHRMHHTDLEFDVSTALRFHPFELLLSMLIKLAAILLLGAPAAGVLAFEVLLSSSALFNHANLRLPAAVDSALRTLIVTPDMHRVHHSVRPAETNSNFGFFLSLWDRWCSSYTAQPADGHATMQIGLSEWRDPQVVRLDRMLVNPFAASD